MKRFISLLFCLMFTLNLVSIGLHANVPTTNSLQFYSQASQDKFAYILLYKLLNKGDAGSYLDIGAGHPVDVSNSYFFVKNFQWKGVAIDWWDQHPTEWREIRPNTLLLADALKVDYQTTLSPLPRIIDYLSLDVDYHYEQVLERIPFRDYIFRVITIEHDGYRYGDMFRIKEREILSSLGYYLLCPDVIIEGFGEFEDWWIHPVTFPESIVSQLKRLDLRAKTHGELIRILDSVTLP